MRNRSGTFRTGTIAAQVGFGTLAIGALLGIGATLTPPTAGADAPAVRTSETEMALAALTTSGAEDARTAIPTAFTDRFYVPSVENGVLVNPDGDCSSPIPLPPEFDGPCKAHDLGYDLLRFGAASTSISTETGTETGTETAMSTARRELDTRLGEEMHESCSTRSGIGSRASCNVMAEIATAAVRFNSWRQHYGTPEPEPALPYLLAGGVGIGIVAIAASTMSLTAPLRLREVSA